MRVTRGIQMKKGSQQTRKAPRRNPRLRAIRVSRKVRPAWLQQHSTVRHQPYANNPTDTDTQQVE